MEQLTQVGDVELCWEGFGDPSHEPVLLVMGLGTQMVAWREEFCARLVEREHYVVRFDNRDVGRSTHLTHHPPPTPVQLVRRDRSAAAYTLQDMADDAGGLLEALDLGPAHVVGASMGGMIAQTLAATRPEQVRSLVSIMSTTGSRWAGQPAIRLYPYLLRKAPRDRELYVEHALALVKAIGSPGFPRDEAETRRLAGVSFDRAIGDSAGVGRQLAAILASGDRTAQLRRITCPTHVVHGTADRLVRPSGGKATAKAIPGARLTMVEGMGHDLPEGTWPHIISALDDVVERSRSNRVGLTA